MTLDDVTMTIVNWRTLDLVRACAESLLHFYPEIQVLIIDNDSRDASTTWIGELARSAGNVSAVMNQGHALHGVAAEKLPLLAIHDFRPLVSAIGFAPGDREAPFQEKVLRGLWRDGNVGHGPALHQAFELTKTRYAFALDSDCVVQAGGFIEEMLEIAVRESAYAIGRDVYLAPRGGHSRQGFGGYHHVHTSVSLLDMEKYKTLLPYVLYGVSGILNMPDAQFKGYAIIDFPIGKEDSAVYHAFRGSRKRHGVPKLRSLPFLPEVFLKGLKTEYIGEYFK